MTQDDTLLRRQIAAVQLGLLAALAVLVLGPEAVDLSRSMAAQLPVLLLAVVGALLVERRTRAVPVRGQHERGPGRVHVSGPEGPRQEGLSRWTRTRPG